jgi:putative FmdB family regulatory protein
MPIYEYRCSTCGYANEYLQKVSDPRLTDCPECGKATFEKLVSAAGFQLKGSGWYVTDFKNNGAKPKADKEGKAESGDKPKAESGDKSKGESGDKPKAGSGDKPKVESAQPKKEDKPEPARGTGARPACT